MNVVEPIALYVVFVFSTTAHEAAHAWAALQGGDPTAYRGGQVSLNPIPHIKREPIGMVLVPLLALANGFCLGWASTPYDPLWEQRHPRRAAWMAAAGPGANMILAISALALLRYGLATDIFYPPEQVRLWMLVGASSSWAAGAGMFLSILLVLNTLLAILNLIPFPPLDGATVITLLASDDTALRVRETLRSPQIGWIGLIAIYFLFGEVIGPVFQALLYLVHPSSAYY